MTIYQWVCFPIYRIARVPRREYFVIDRHRLAYLNAIEKANCTFCSYANGVIAYVCEVAARTEQYWCPIKHARAIAAHTCVTTCSSTTATPKATGESSRSCGGRCGRKLTRAAGRVDAGATAEPLGEVFVKRVSWACQPQPRAKRAVGEGWRRGWAAYAEAPAP